MQNKNQNFNGAARNNTSNVRHHISAVRQVSFAVFSLGSVVLASLSIIRIPFFFCLDLFCNFSLNFQGSVGKRRSRFQGNQFPVTTNIARKAATAAPLDTLGRAFNGGRMTSAYQSRSRMLDSSSDLFVNLKSL